jgi:hypothetical protein
MRHQKGKLDFNMGYNFYWETYRDDLSLLLFGRKLNEGTPSRIDDKILNKCLRDKNVVDTLIPLLKKEMKAFYNRIKGEQQKDSKLDRSFKGRRNRKHPENINATSSYYNKERKIK